MGRLDTSMHPPPVRIGLVNARQIQDTMLEDVQRTAKGAGNYGQREARNGNIPVRLVIQANHGPNTQAAREAAIAAGVTRRKRGFPPIVTLPTAPLAK